MNKYTFRSLSLVLTASLLTACASGPMALTPSEMQPFPAAADRTPIRTSLSFQIQSSVDQREMGPHQLGWSGTSVDKRRPVVVETTVADLVAERLRNELNMRGFQSRPPGDIGLHLILQKFEVKTDLNGPFQTPTCEAKVMIEMSRTGKTKKASLQVNSNFMAPAPVFKTELANSQTVASCLNLVAERIAKSSELQALLAE